MLTRERLLHERDRLTVSEAVLHELGRQAQHPVPGGGEPAVPPRVGAPAPRVVAAVDFHDEPLPRRAELEQGAEFMEQQALEYAGRK